MERLINEIDSRIRIFIIMEQLVKYELADDSVSVLSIS